MNIFINEDVPQNACYDTYTIVSLCDSTSTIPVGKMKEKTAFHGEHLLITELLFVLTSAVVTTVMTATFPKHVIVQRNILRYQSRIFATCAASLNFGKHSGFDPLKAICVPSQLKILCALQMPLCTPHCDTSNVQTSVQQRSCWLLLHEEWP